LPHPGPGRTGSGVDNRKSLVPTSVGRFRFIFIEEKLSSIELYIA
jgi:hypothetical protein